MNDNNFIKFATEYQQILEVQAGSGRTIDEFLKLPLSGLLELALSDMRAMAMNPKYTFSMDSWYRVDNGTFYICMAGAVMANTMGVTLSSGTHPLNELVESCLPDGYRSADTILKVGKRLNAINCARTGVPTTALYFVGAAYLDYPGLGDRLQQIAASREHQKLPVNETAGLSGLVFVERYEAYFRPLIDVLKQYGL